MGKLSMQHTATDNFDDGSFWKYRKNTMRNKRQVFSYDAVIERKELEDAKMAIRTKLVQGRSHEIFQRCQHYLLLAKDSSSLLNQIAVALRSHAKVCNQCSLKQKQASAEQSRQLFRKVLKQNPKSGSALMAFALPFFGKKGNRFVRRVEDIIKKTGEKAYYTHIGHFYKARHNYKKAEYFYRKALPRIPYHYGIMYALAVLYIEMGRLGAAKKYATFALRRYTLMNSFYKKDPVTKAFIAELKAIKKNGRNG